MTDSRPHDPNDPNDLLTKSEVADLLRVSLSVINREIAEGKLRIVHLGRGVDPRRGAVRVTRRALNDYITAQEVYVKPGEAEEVEEAEG